ncbi:hypothetical protein VQ196_000153 [Salmonella enterica]|uniref:hypothetical protein n=1 Tax=Salmonella TaxID=590 RepID=UPI000B4CA356|nr:MULTISPECIES: hypothetical protein [Salmonella]EEJ0198152.1 hypothetical protein [Salmonella enterica subsp. enterica]EHN1527917.1 hypothetical protein [Salmonella enterica]HBZ1757530.1 hypothetical protein [Salmonella enterica subsp. enterica serovar Bredeney]EBG0050129.1 hypothetical protein [Salmonella enterica subsp. enterica serovar Schwarzengrund]ECB3134862.1 hypothetical protein [Salmonella enterica subsp. enterica serovar Schwarzengrund]
MPTIIESLVVTLGLDPSGFKKGQTEVKKGLDDTRKNADQTAKEMEAAGKRAASFFGSIRTELLALVGVTLSAQGIKTFIVDMTNNLQQLAIGSKSLDMSAKSLDGWQRSAEAAGSSAEKITGTLSAFQNTLTKIRTGGAQGDPLFGALASFAGATGANFDYQNDNSEAIMRKIAANWSKLSKDAQRRFGSEFGFDNATQQGLANGNLVRDADRFAKISRATDDATRKAQEFNRRLVEMKQNFSAAAQVLYEALIPYVEKLIPLIEKFGNWIATHGPEISKFFSDSAAEVNKIVDTVGGLQNAFAILATFVAGSWALKMLSGITKVGKGFGPILAAMATVSAWNKVGEAQEEAKKEGISVGELLIKRMKDKDNERLSSGDTISDRIMNWWKSLPDADNTYTAYGTAPRGVRNNNPGNLNYVGQAGATKEGGANGRFAVFPSMAHGISALYKQIQLYFKRGINTISSIVNKYAPAGDGNDVASYISALVNATGKGANDALDAGDTPTIARLMKGIVDHENGKGYISSSDIMGGIQLGSSASVSGMAGAAGNKTEINIGEMNMQTSSSNVNALGNDIQRHVNRNRLVTPAMSGQG